MKLGEITEILGSASAPEGSEREPLGYSIDSRTVRAGELFFAIRGERYDGHDFVSNALANGATHAVVSREFAAQSSDRRLIPVKDTLAGLQSLAGAVLRSWQGREVAVTGSMGKTTTKEMTASLLSRVGRVMKTTGNLNNAYGLPLSILKMETDGARASDFDFAVLEMGMNHKGELTELTRIAPPDLAIVTNVAPVHLEFFSSVDEIARAKAELVAGVKSSGAAVLNADDYRVARMREMRGDINYCLFGIERQADVMAQDIRSEGLGGTRFLLITPRGQIQARIPVAGRHNVYNALASVAAAEHAGAPLDLIVEALAESQSPRMRGEILRFNEGFTVIDDSYNSNPLALVEMVTTVSANRDFSRKIVVAGEMLELGQTAAALHREAGRRIAELGIDLVIGVRGLARETVEGAREAGIKSAFFFETPDEAAEFLAREAQAGDLILIKGSRGVRCDTVVERMKQKSAVTGR
jgi:UDP-N-acetylmuramoyl-tripeptide--D-alanyl-D-alanine ligase